MMLHLKHTRTVKGEVLYILYWTDTVCEVLSVWILELCLQFLCYRTFPLCLRFVPLNTFVLTFATNTGDSFQFLYTFSTFKQKV